jgi:Cu/Ag efflux protein CusF
MKMNQMNPTQPNMRQRNPLNLAPLTILSVVIIGLASCSSSTPPKGKSSGYAAYHQQGVPGGVTVQTYQETATVRAIDAANRKVTLVSPDGTQTTVKAGPEVVNFGQIRVGDQVKATLVEQLVVFVREEGMPSSGGQASMVALAPVGAKPGVVMADTVEITATVRSIDLRHHKATLQFPSGRTSTFSVRPDVDLTKAKIGQEVVIRTTESMALAVEKP